MLPGVEKIPAAHMRVASVVVGTHARRTHLDET